MLSLRVIRGIIQAAMRCGTSAGSKLFNGVRKRIELKDLFDQTLVAAGHSSLRTIQQNDQARERLAEKLWDTMHHQHVVLRKVRRHP